MAASLATDQSGDAPDAVRLHGIYEVRTTGDDHNGGGFYPDIAGGVGTDYSQQDAPELVITDLACAGGSAPWTLTSVIGGFTAAMLGNVIAIEFRTSGGHGHGTNWTGGRYPIIEVVDANTIIVGRTISIMNILATGTGSGGHACIGGAIAHPSMATGGGIGGYWSNVDNAAALLGGGDIVWVKAGTYLETTIDSAGGLYFGAQGNGSLLLGYKTSRGDNPTGTDRPVIQSDPSQVSSAGIDLLQLTVGGIITIANLVFDGNSYCNEVLTLASGSNTIRNCDFKNGRKSGVRIQEGRLERCRITSNGASGNDWVDPASFDFTTCGIYFRGSHPILVDCRVDNNHGPGIYIDNGEGSCTRVIIDHNQGPGVFIDYGNGDNSLCFDHCDFDANGFDGINSAYDSNTPMNQDIMKGMNLRNCVFTNNGVYGINSIDDDYRTLNSVAFAMRMTGCAFFNNTSGNFNRVPAPLDMITLTADPWTSASTGDYTPNSAAGGGALLKGAAI